MKIGSAYKKSAKVKTSPQGILGQNTKEKENVEKVSEGNPHLEKMLIIRGRDIETGLPRSLKITEAEIREALSPIITQITQTVADVLEETPPELLPDILEQGVLLTGGGAQLAGLDLLLAERIHMPVVVSNDPLTSVVRGTGKVLEDDAVLERVKVIGGLK